MLFKVIKVVVITIIYYINPTQILPFSQSHNLLHVNLQADPLLAGDHTLDGLQDPSIPCHVNVPLLRRSYELELRSGDRLQLLVRTLTSSSNHSDPVRASQRTWFSSTSLLGSDERSEELEKGAKRQATSVAEQIESTHSQLVAPHSSLTSLLLRRVGGQA